MFADKKTTDFLLNLGFICVPPNKAECRNINKCNYISIPYIREFVG